MAEPLLSLVTLLVEVAVYLIFSEIMGLVVSKFTVVTFWMMGVLMLAKGLVLFILGRRDVV